MVAHSIHLFVSEAFDAALEDSVRYCGDTHVARLATTRTVIPIPKNHKSAHLGPHSKRWKAAELKAEGMEWALWDIGTFSDDVLRSSLPPTTKIHRMNWVYKCKPDKDKARLCFDAGPEQLGAMTGTTHLQHKSNQCESYWQRQQ
jgi:hypothetical protein